VTRAVAPHSNVPLLRAEAVLVKERADRGLGDLPAMRAARRVEFAPANQACQMHAAQAQVVRSLLGREGFTGPGAASLGGATARVALGRSDPCPSQKISTRSGQNRPCRGDGSTTTWSSTAASISRRWPTSELFPRRARGPAPEELGHREPDTLWPSPDRCSTSMATRGRATRGSSRRTRRTRAR